MKQLPIMYVGFDYERVLYMSLETISANINLPIAPKTDQHQHL